VFKLKALELYLTPVAWATFFRTHRSLSARCTASCKAAIALKSSQFCHGPSCGRDFLTENINQPHLFHAQVLSISIHGVRVYRLQLLGQNAHLTVFLIGTRRSILIQVVELHDANLHQVFQLFSSVHLQNATVDGPPAIRTSPQQLTDSTLLFSSSSLLISSWPLYKMFPSTNKNTSSFRAPLPTMRTGAWKLALIARSPKVAACFTLQLEPRAASSLVWDVLWYLASPGLRLLNRPLKCEEYFQQQQNKFLALAQVIFQLFCYMYTNRLNKNFQHVFVLKNTA